MTSEAARDEEAEGAPPPDRAGPTEFDVLDLGEVPDTPDALDLVLEVADMMAICAAQQFVRVDAARREALAEAERVGGRALTDVAERSVRLELAAVLRITEHAVDEMLCVAEALVHRYPTVLESLGRARMTERHARFLVEALDQVEPSVRDPLLTRAVELAEGESVGTFRRALRRLIDASRAETLSERYERALQKRRVIVVPADDGMAWISAHVPAVEAHAVHSRITAIAKVLGTHESEARTLDQLRADVFADLLIDGDTASHPKEARGIRATVAVTVPVLSLLGEGGAAEPAVVEGIGPIPIDRARELCGSADSFLRILTHPETGMVLSVGRDQYRPPAALRKLARWRADRCMAPGCGIPASRCDIDHSIAWEHGGHTSLGNLSPLCRGHHMVKHHGGWTVSQHDGGALEWISPSGRGYVVQPERRVPVFHPVVSSSTASAGAPF